MRYQTTINQLSLNLEPKNEVSFASFCWGKHFYWKENFINLGTPQQKEHFFYVFGERGSGKSHLLQACCHHIPVLQTAVYLSLKNYHEYGPDLLDGIDNQTLIAIDDIDAVCQEAAWEEKLFHLINRVRQHRDQTIILAGKQAPNLINFNLQDLKSRLHLGLSIQLIPPSDEQKKQIIKSFAYQRGIILANSILDYLMQHYDRNLHALMELVRVLDKASLAAKRKITIPFIKAVLQHEPVKSG